MYKIAPSTKWGKKLYTLKIYTTDETAGKFILPKFILSTKEGKTLYTPNV